MTPVRTLWVLTHPVQYFAPLFRNLAQRPELDFHVIYGCRYGMDAVVDEAYGKAFRWDTDYTVGHSHSFCENPGGKYSLTFAGIPAVDLRQQLQRLSPELVIVNGYDFQLDWRAVWWARRNSVPVVARPEFAPGISDYPFWKRAIGWGAKRVFFRLLSGGLACSRYSARRLESFLPKRPIYACPFFVDNDLFPPIPDAEIAKERSSWDIPLDASVLLFVGRLIPLKRLSDALHALIGNQWYLAVVGDGPARQELGALARELGVARRVRFLGFRNQKQLPRIYAAADAVLLLSDRESWGMCVNEGMAAGRTAVVSDRCMCGPDLVIPERTGLIYPVGDVGALIESIERALLNRRKWGENARRHVRENYNAAVAARGVVECAQALCRNGVAVVNRHEAISYGR